MSHILNSFKDILLYNKKFHRNYNYLKKIVFNSSSILK